MTGGRHGHTSELPAAESDAPTDQDELPSRRASTAMCPGVMVGEYEIDSVLGEGGMGTVYAAVQPVIGKRVAIKILRRELCANPETVARFVQEAKAVNRIGHPNIVDIFSLGELDDGRSYFVMEMLRGEDLDSRIERGPISLDEVCHILDGLACALEAAHAKGIIHRDLKPENVFLHVTEAGVQTIKLLDFGIAKLVGDAAPRLERTRTGSMMGTPRYISPEQARGVAVGGATDVYSLGALAYQLVVGEPPFDAETAMDIVLLHMTVAPPRPSERVALPGALDDLIVRMLAKAADERPTLHEIRSVLAQVTGQAPAAWIRRASEPSVRPLTPAPSLEPAPRRHGLGLVGVAVLAIAGVVAWQIIDSGNREPSERPAPRVAAAPTPVAPPASPPTTPAPAPATEGSATVETGELTIEIKGGGEAEIVVGNQSVVGRVANFVLPVGPQVVEIRAGTTSTKRDVMVKPGRERIAIEVAAPRAKLHPPAAKPPSKTAVAPPPAKPPVEPAPPAAAKPNAPEPDNPGNGLMRPGQSDLIKPDAKPVPK